MSCINYLSFMQISQDFKLDSHFYKFLSLLVPHVHKNNEGKLQYKTSFVGRQSLWYKLIHKYGWYSPCMYFQDIFLHKILMVHQHMCQYLLRDSF